MKIQRQASGAAAVRHIGTRDRNSERITFHLMLLPGIIALLVFVFVPLLGSVMAFQNFSVSKGIFRSKWVGLMNFEFIFSLCQFCLPSCSMKCGRKG